MNDTETWNILIFAFIIIIIGLAGLVATTLIRIRRIKKEIKTEEMGGK